jgi:hypothetical protein
VVDWIGFRRCLGRVAAIPAARLDTYARDSRNHAPYHPNRRLPQTKSRPETLILTCFSLCNLCVLCVSVVSFLTEVAQRIFKLGHHFGVNRLDLANSFGNNAPVWGIF